MALFDTTSRAVGGSLELCWRTSREFHPSEYLSELPPLFETVAGQEYHYVLTAGHCETACQSCFWMDGNRWAPYLAVFYSRSEIRCNSVSATGGLGASSASLSVFSNGPSGNVFQLPDIQFSSCTREFLPSPLLLDKSEVKTKHLLKFF